VARIKKNNSNGNCRKFGFLFLLVVFVYFYQCFASCFNILRGPCVESIISPRTSFHGRPNRYNNHRRGLVLLLVLLTSYALQYVLYKKYPEYSSIDTSHLSQCGSVTWKLIHFVKYCTHIHILPNDVFH